ncbi:MAG: hypothetical protein AAFZ07_24345 [Actinomycetota bacterium]
MGDEELGDVWRRREAILDATAAVEAALAAPAAGEGWRETLRNALIGLHLTIHDHVAETEGPDGFLLRVRDDAPRLARQVERLIGEHTDLTDLSTKLIERLDGVALERTEEEAAAVRDDALHLLATVVRHRQRGADLIYEAYQVDVGGPG